MRPIYLAGLGLTPVGEHWDRGLRQLALEAILAAQQDLAQRAGPQTPRPEAVFVGNMLAGQLSGQEHLGALVADYAGLRGLEAVTVEAAGAGGAAALRQAVLAVGSGQLDTALVVGVEKMTDRVGAGVTAAAATAADTDWEAAQGVTPTALAALLMQRYLTTYGRSVADFAGFTVNAHANAKTNPNAMFHNAISAEAYAQAAMVADPVNMFDAAPDADGAAALIVTAEPAAVQVLASAVATDTLALHDRGNLLEFDAARLATVRAYQQAGVGPEDLDLFELHDAYTIFAALSLEAAGFALPGQGVTLAQPGAIGRAGRIPIATFGGLKARGNPGAASGVYQVAEVAQQLRGEAGPNQVAGAKLGMAQSLGGAAATAVTTILACA
ncbi:MAG: thiolase domain-containing protein [Anaerolineales bacterium]|nr:thiolase domain-containing protein [Anaerolineales bacterium]